MPTATLDRPNPPSAAEPDHNLSVEEQDYLFDLLGYRVIKGALSERQLQAINDWVDGQPIDELKLGDWIGDVEVHHYSGGSDGLNFQNIVEAGPVFEEMIDNPAWFEQVRRYIMRADTGLYIDECFLNIRRRGGYIGIHSGGHGPGLHSQFRWHTGAWAVGQINIIMALTDVGPGDGCTTLVPSSHKSHELHPAQRHKDFFTSAAAGENLGMIEMHLKAGDALMFTDALCHGSSARTNPGERRVMIYRYAPRLRASRYHYLPSEELLARLTPERREIIQPIPPRMRPGRVLKFDTLPPFKG